MNYVVGNLGFAAFEYLISSPKKKINQASEMLFNVKVLRQCSLAAWGFALKCDFWGMRNRLVAGPRELGSPPI